jgi:hypothetical protein
MRFTSQFSLGLSQAEVDFVDVDTTKDTPLFIDPTALQNLGNELAQRCSALVTSYFQAVVDAIRAGDDSRATLLLSGLTEPNETRLGLTRGSRSAGRGVGTRQAIQLLESLKGSAAVRSGFVTDLGTCELLVEGIGPDKMSDITTNIIRGELIKYTQDQCHLHGVSLPGSYPAGRVWDAGALTWTPQYAHLPAVGTTLILVPKAFVRWKTSFSAQKYYDDFVLNYLRQEEISTNGPLVQRRVSGEPFVTKETLKRRTPLTKDFLYRFSSDHPEILAAFKEKIGKSKTLSVEEVAKLVEDKFSEREFAESLKERLILLPAGSENATKYHKLALGIMEFLFFPNLTYPKIEQEIHDGRKRVDIVFQNAMESGPFSREGRSGTTRASCIMVECKNYTKEIRNPELDQIQGRFSNTRGWLGIITCRKLDDSNRFAEGCRDTARDGRGFVIHLEDTDFIRALDFVIADDRAAIDRIIEEKLIYLRT